MLWFQGGAFVQLYNPNYNGTGLIEASQGNMIVATFNYRVGPYGFLASKELKAEKNLNMGIHDQRTAIRWVQHHISKFGGDPNKLTLFGTSVGGGSVLLQLLAYGGNPPAGAVVDWSAGIAEAVYMPSVYQVDELDFQYETLLKATDCSSLTCLRELPIETLQAANIARPFPGQSEAALFGYGPVIDGSLFPDRPLKLLKQGRFLHKPLILGSSHTEGTIFATQSNNTEDVDAFIRAQYPSLTDHALQRLNEIYSDTPKTFPGVEVPDAPLYYRTAKMYGDAGFACPALDFAQGLSKAGLPIYLFRDHILDPVEVAAGYIVPHTWEVQAVWGPQHAKQYVALPGADSYDAGKSNAVTVPVVQSYWTSFARSGGNPSSFKAEEAPLWEEFGLGRRLKLQTNATSMEQVGQTEAERCDFWSTLAPLINQ